MTSFCGRCGAYLCEIATKIEMTTYCDGEVTHNSVAYYCPDCMEQINKGFRKQSSGSKQSRLERFL